MSYESTMRVVASGSVTNANMTVTLTAGLADIDLSSATVPRNYKGHLLVIRDSANVAIKGFVYTDGTGTVQNVVSAKGGTTRNWTVQETGFNNNDDGGYTYEIWKVNDAPVVASGSVTQANMKISAAATYAFVDFSTASVLTDYADGRHILGVYDSSGRGILGHIKAVGTGETLSEEKLQNSNDWTGASESIPTTGWIAGGSVGGLYDITAGGQSGNYIKITWGGTGQGYPTMYTSDAPTLYALYYGTWYCQKGTASYANVNFVGNDDPSIPYSEDTDWNTQKTYYRSAISTNSGYLLFRTRASAQDQYAMFDTASVKQVLTPSSTGVTISSIKNGTAMDNWFYKHASFNYDDSSNYTYKIMFVGD